MLVLSRLPRWTHDATDWTARWLLWIASAMRDLVAYYTGPDQRRYAAILLSIEITLVFTLGMAIYLFKVPLSISTALGVAVYLLPGLFWMFRPYR